MSFSYLHRLMPDLHAATGISFDLLSPFIDNSIGATETGPGQRRGGGYSLRAPPILSRIDRVTQKSNFMWSTGVCYKLSPSNNIVSTLSVGHMADNIGRENEFVLGDESTGLSRSFKTQIVHTYLRNTVSIQFEITNRDVDTQYICGIGFSSSM